MIAQIILLIIICLLSLCQLYLFSRTKRTAENDADIKQNRKKEYESEKGRNLATKEDIAEITKQIEGVKNAVAFSNQKKYEQKVEQEKLLISILHRAQTISSSQNKLLFFQHDLSTRKRLDSLVELVVDDMTTFFYECNLAEATINDDGVHQVIKQLSLAVSALGSEVCVNAANSANFIDQYIFDLEQARNMSISEESRLVWVKKGTEAKTTLEDMREKPLEHKIDLQKAIAAYCAVLKELYGRDFFYPDN